MKIKTDFWEKINPKKVNRIIWIYGIFTLMNFVYYGYKSYTMFIINLAPTILFIIMILSYNKYEKKVMENEKNKTN